ncbi:MAG: pyridoxamine 5'-phosphate oxidase family protein, partial [Acidimicrobiia bacterium]
GRQRIEAHELILLGTIKADGSPRISPVEPDFVDGELMMGMMWQSTKALDLLRDPRCVVHSVVTDRRGTEGEFKIIGEARTIVDGGLTERYCQVLEDRIDWRPDGDFHLFAIDIHRVWWFKYDGEQRLEERWTAPGGEPDVK